MSESKFDSEQTYRIDTQVKAGSVEDPVTGEMYGLEDGIVEVSRPDSAQYLVQSNSRFEYVGNEPTEKAIKEAEKEAHGFDMDDVIHTFAGGHRHGSIASQEYGAGEGFDPKSGDAINDPRMKAKNGYEALREMGEHNLAEYLRALPKTSLQENFVDYLRESEGMDV